MVKIENIKITSLGMQEEDICGFCHTEILFKFVKVPADRCQSF